MNPAFSRSCFATGAEILQHRDVGLLHEHDRRAVIARLLQELPRLGGISGELVVPAGGRFERRAAGEQRLAFAVPFRIADRGIEEVLAVQRIGDRLADLRVVERLVQRVEAEGVLAPVRVRRQELDVRVLLQERQEVVRRRLDVVDLALRQRVDLGLRVGDPEPLDPVDLHDLGSGEAGGRVRARLVFRVLDVDRLLAGLPVLVPEGERPRAGEVGDLLVRVGVGDALRHHEGHVGAGLGERLEHEPVGLLERHPDGLFVRRLEAGDEGQELLPHGVAGPPALERGDAVLGRDRLAVMPCEPVPQGEGPGQLVGRDLVAIDHLRAHLELVVEREQGVVDHVAVVDGDQRRRPDRVDDLEVRVQGGAQRLRLRRKRRRRREGKGESPGENPRRARSHGALLTLLRRPRSLALRGRRAIACKRCATPIPARATRRAESTPGAAPEADPGLEKGEEGTPKWILRVGRPVASPRFSRPGLIGRGASSRLDHRSSGTLCGAAPCGAAFGVPLAPYGRARLVVAGGRMSSGFPVRRLTEPFGTALQSRRPPESDATERPPRDRLPSACMTRCARGSSPEVLGGGFYSR